MRPRGRALTMRLRSCAAQASGHAWRACTASRARAAVGVGHPGWAAGACGSAAFMHLMHGSTQPIEAALGRCEVGHDGAHARCGAVEGRQGCHHVPS